MWPSLSEMELSPLAVRSGVEPIPDVWPFGNWDDPLVIRINAAVPRSLPEAIRADVCQELAVAILTNDITEIDRTTVMHMIRLVMARDEWRFKWVSLSTPITAGSDLTWGDVL